MMHEFLHTLGECDYFGIAAICSHSCRSSFSLSIEHRVLEEKVIMNKICDSYPILSLNTGFFHEQSRPDRDSYVQVYLQNVETSKHPSFGFEIPKKV